MRQIVILGGILSSLNGSSIVESSSQNTQIGATLSWEVDLFGRLYAAKNAQESFYYQSLEDYLMRKLRFWGTWQIFILHLGRLL